MEVALFRVDSPTSKPVEITGSGYSRVATEFDAGGHNSNDVIFPTATGNWGRVDKVIAYQDDKPLYANLINPSVTVFLGDIVRMPIGAISLASCGVSQYNEPTESFTLMKITIEDVIVGNPIYINTEDKLALASTQSLAEAQAIGFITSNTLANNLASYNTDGYITRQDWTAITGTTQLIPGAYYYLSEIAGKITSTPPTVGYSVNLGRAIYPDTLDIEIQQIIILS